MSAVAGRSEADGAVREIAKRPRTDADTPEPVKNIEQQLLALQLRAEAAEEDAANERKRAEAEAAARKKAEAASAAAEAARKAAEERSPPHISHLTRAAGFSKLLALLMAAAAVAVAQLSCLSLRSSKEQM